MIVAAIKIVLFLFPSKQSREPPPFIISILISQPFLGSLRRYTVDFNEIFFRHTFGSFIRHHYPDLVDVAQLQEMLAVNRHTAYDLIGSGAFKCAKVGRKYLIPKIEIIKFLYKDSISAGGGARA